LKRLLHISWLLFFGICAFFIACKPKKSVANPQQEANADEAYQQYFIDACTHFNNNNYELSLKLFNKCVALKPNEPAVNYYISRIHANTNTTLALQYASKANTVIPSNVFYATWYSSLLKKTAQYDLAISVLENCFKDNPKDEPLVKELDNLYVVKNQYDKRVNLWKSLINNKGFKLPYALKLIEIYKTKKDYTAIHQQYDEIKKAAPNKYQYYIDDGNVYLDQGDKTNAFLNFDKALSINPNNWQLNTILFKHYKNEGNSALAMKYLSQGLNDPYTRFETKAILLSEFNQQFNKDTSVRSYMLLSANTLMASNSGNANATFTAGKFYEQLGDCGKAIAAYTKSLDITPNTYDAWIGNIHCKMKNQLNQKTISYIDSALEYFPSASGLYLLGAKNAAWAKQWNKALELSQSGLSFALYDSTKFDLLILKAKSECAKNNLSAANSTLQSALDLKLESADYFDVLGDINFKQNKTSEAICYWKKALSLGSDNPILSKKINESKYYE